ncbi:hypothetical protein [Sorangium sp. So ce1151]
MNYPSRNVVPEGEGAAEGACERGDHGGGGEGSVGASSPIPRLASWAHAF